MLLYTEIDNSLKLVEWIKRSLGYPTIQIEIEDSTILDAIDSSLQYFQRFSGNSYYMNALAIQLTPGVNLYAVPDDIANIIDFDATFSYGTGVTTLFTAENILYHEGLLAGYSPLEVVSWELAQNFIDSVTKRFTSKFFLDFNKYKKELKFTPTPRKATTGLLICYSYYSHDLQSPIYNEIWVKKYALALTKITLGQIWGKYNGMPIPGGGTLNGDALKSEGITERDNLENDIINFESEPLGFLVG